MQNPYADPHWNDDGPVSGFEAQAFEEGAAAQLEELKSKGIYGENVGTDFLHTHLVGRTGWFVVIPDNEADVRGDCSICGHTLKKCTCVLPEALFHKAKLSAYKCVCGKEYQMFADGAKCGCLNGALYAESSQDHREGKNESR